MLKKEVKINRYKIIMDENSKRDIDELLSEIKSVLDSKVEDKIINKQDVFSVKNVREEFGTLIVSIERLENYDVPHIKNYSPTGANRTEISLEDEDYIVHKITNIIFKPDGSVLSKAGRGTISLNRFKNIFLRELDDIFKFLPEMNIATLEEIEGKSVKKIDVHGKPEHFMDVFSFTPNTNESEACEATVTMSVKIPKKNGWEIESVATTLRRMKERAPLSKCVVTCNEDDKFVQYFLSETQLKDSIVINYPKGATVYESTIIDKMMEL